MRNPKIRPQTTKPFFEAEAAVRTLLETIGEDPARPGLKDTPSRVVKAWLEMTRGYGDSPAEILKRDFDGEGYDQMIMTRRVQVVSTCEHHMLPFTGHAWIAYVPSRRVVGLSKMSRLVKCFSRRLQIQERLTQEIAQAMVEHLRPKGVAVRVCAVHSCMTCRGVMEPEADMVTTALTGVFRQHKVKEEFLLQCV